MKGWRERFRRSFFHSAFLGIFFNPFYFSRMALRKAVARSAPAITGAVLDLGCGIKPYRSFFRCDTYTGLEYDTQKNRRSKNADAFYTGTAFPFESESFDAALSTQVLEHVFTPDAFLEETHRVLKPSGKLLLTVPFFWDEHETPYDFGRYTSFGLAHLFEKHGFRILRQEKTCADASVLFQMLNVYIFRKISFRSTWLTLLLRSPFVAFVNITGLCLSWILPRNGTLYLDNVILAEKIRSEELLVAQAEKTRAGDNQVVVQRDAQHLERIANPETQ